MLNDAQRNHVRIAMSLIEEKMHSIAARLATPKEHGLMCDIQKDITPEMARVLRQKIQVVYAVIRELRDRFALPVETKQASREILKGLPQLWVMLQETDAKSLVRFGAVDPALAPVFDPQIKTLARLMFDLENSVLGKAERASHSVSDKV